jgi:hypothetical protein
MKHQLTKVPGFFSSPGLGFIVFGFVTTNIGTDPDPTAFFGCGGTTGSGGITANGGPSVIKSITKTANAGEFLVTLNDHYRAMWLGEAQVMAPAGGPADGYSAQVSLGSNFGASSSDPTFLITTLNTSKAAAETAGKTVTCMAVVKDSGAGS